jgi:sigma-B regulation protein RsbU (phosphoserine phosphatase)
MDMFIALRAAIRAEIATQKMYRKMAEEVTDPEVKSLFNFFAGYEITHQRFLEAELRALESANGDKEGTPSHWLQLLNEKIQLQSNGSIESDFNQIRLNLAAAESIAKILREANEELLDKQVRYENELSIAAGIQKKLLPQKVPEDMGLQISTLNIMAMSVGGDYYDFLKNNRDQLAIVVGDSMGKGMPAALLMTTVRAVWQSWSVSGFESPGEILNMINRTVYPDLHATGAFITMFCALYDPGTANFKYCNAGHNPPILHRISDSDCVQMSIGGIPVGMFPDTEFHSDEVILRKNDLVVMYTDGVVEAINKNDVEFGFKRLCEIININHKLDPENITKEIMSEIASHTGNSSFADDVTIVILKKI